MPPQNFVWFRPFDIHSCFAQYMPIGGSLDPSDSTYIIKKGMGAASFTASIPLTCRYLSLFRPRSIIRLPNKHNIGNPAVPVPICADPDLIVGAVAHDGVMALAAAPGKHRQRAAD